MELGGNIRLSGFNELDSAMMVVAKKMIGTFARKLSSMGEFEGLHVTLKPVHAVESSRKYEIQAMTIIGNKRHSAEFTDKNLFFCLDKVFKKLENSLPTRGGVVG
jgi:hypothetical protein